MTPPVKKPRKPRIKQIPEYNVQVSLCALLSARGVFFFSIPNERQQPSAAAVMRLRKMGMIIGMPDLCILHNGKPHFLELKRIGGTLTDNQKRVQAALNQRGYPVRTAWGFNEAVQVCQEWGIL